MNQRQTPTLKNYNSNHPVIVNNRAAALLNAHNEGMTCCLDDTIRMLTESLRALRELMSCELSNVVADQDMMMSNASYGSLSASLDDCIPNHQLLNNTTSTSTTCCTVVSDKFDERNEELSTVKAALVVPDCLLQQMMNDPAQRLTLPSSSSTTVSKCYCLSSVVVMYNLALAHHLQALSLLRRRAPSTTVGKVNNENMATIQRYYTKALQLYEHSFNLCDGEGMLDCTSMVFSLIIVNNMGTIFRTLNEPQKAAQCFQRNLSMTMFIIDSGMLLPPQTTGGSSNTTVTISRIPEAVFRNTINLVFQQASGDKSGSGGCTKTAAAA